MLSCSAERRRRGRRKNKKKKKKQSHRDNFERNIPAFDFKGKANLMVCGKIQLGSSVQLDKYQVYVKQGKSGLAGMAGHIIMYLTAIRLC